MEMLVRRGWVFGGQRAYQEIVDVARQQAVDLVVIASQGLTGLDHLILGSTAERVSRHAPCPVLIVRCSAQDREQGTH
jgi:nucleotide-binding universal stress UspA family protein